MKKSKLTENLGIKLLSVLFAVLLWVIVLNISDYLVTVEIDDIPVEKINESVLEELDKVYDVASGDTVDITVKGRRSVVSKLDKNDFKAVADFSTMSITNTVQIQVTPKNGTLYNEVNINCRDNTMKLNLEEKISVQLPIRIEVTGKPADRYAVAETFTTPNIIVVEGPKSAVTKIVEAIAVIDVSGKKDSFVTKSDITLYDAYMEPVKNDRVKVSQGSVNVNANIYPQKSVPVNIKVRGIPASGYEIEDIIYTPQEVMIAGETEELRKVTEIEIKDISVSGLTEKLETTVSLDSYLPDGITVANGSSEIAVTVNIARKIARDMEITKDDIILKGTNPSLSYSIYLPDNFKVMASGLETKINELDKEEIKPTIDCTRLTVGEYTDMKPECDDIEGVTYTIYGCAYITIEKK